MSIADVLLRLDAMEKKFDDRFDKLQAKIDTVTARVDDFEARLTVVEEKSKSLSLLEKKYQSAIKTTKIAGIMAEFKSKELNVLLNNIPQDDDEEDMNVSLEKAKTFLKEVLKIDEDVGITHAHRLPKGGSVNCRPLIIKVASMFEKEKLWKKIRNVGTYNDGKESAEKRYVEMLHLPKKLFKDKMSLKNDFKKHKDNGRKPRWRLDSHNGEFCYIIGAVWYRPEVRPDYDN